MNVYIDTNIALDLLLGRAPFDIASKQLFALADNGKINLYFSSLSFSTIHYILAKQLGKDKAIEVLRKFRLLVNILPIDEKVVDLALNSNFSDFEDAMQYYCALRNNTEVLLTRNIKDYKNAKMSVMTTDAFVKQLNYK